VNLEDEKNQLGQSLRTYQKESQKLASILDHQTPNIDLVEDFNLEIDQTDFGGHPETKKK
jgi:hypothetical protein